MKEIIYIIFWTCLPTLSDDKCFSQLFSMSAALDNFVHTNIILFD